MLVEVVIGFGLIYLIWQLLKKPAGLPPGHWGLPLIGHIHLNFKSFDEQAEDLHKRYGDIVLWRMGVRPVILLYDYNLIKEAFNRPEIQERPDMEVLAVNAEGDNVGIAFSSGDSWHQSRRFCLRHLRDLGMGKSKLVSAVHREAMSVVDSLKATAGKPKRLPTALSVAVINVIWQMATGQHHSLNDPKMTDFQQTVLDFFAAVDSASRPYFMPWLKTITPGFIARRIFSTDQLMNVKNKLVKFFYETIDEHERNLDPNDPRDYIDVYLIEMRATKNDPSSVFTRKNLMMHLSDFFIGSVETTPAILQWCLLYLATNPRVQRRLQAEVDEVVPDGKPVTLEDKTRMPYCEAFIHEVNRHSSMVSVAGFHGTTEDTTLGGYKIPKGSLIFPVMTHVHFNPLFWENPKDFLPERFLDEQGKFTFKREGYLPFGIGKRMCIGEGLAKMEMFVFTVTFLQYLNIYEPPGKKIDMTPDPRIPLEHFPKMDQDVLIKVRA